VEEKIRVMKTPLLFKARELEKQEREDVSKLTNGLISSRLQFNRLKPYAWLNDEIINAFYIILGIRSRQCGENDLYLSTHFFQQLLDLDKNGNGEINYEKVKRLMNRQGKNALDFRRIFAPINDGKDHWSFILCKVDEKKIIYYDPIKERRRRGTKYTTCFLDFLMKESVKGTAIDKRDWALITAYNIPTQSNSYDCGVFMCVLSDILSLKDYAMPNELVSLELNRYRELLAVWLGRIEVVLFLAFQNIFLFIMIIILLTRSIHFLSRIFMTSLKECEMVTTMSNSMTMQR